MAIASELVRLRALSIHDQQTINVLKSQLTATELQLGDCKDMLFVKEDQIISLEGRLAILEDEKKKVLEDMTARMEFQRSKFQGVLDSSYFEYYLKGYKQAKVGGSPEVNEDSSFDKGVADDS